MGVMLGLGVMLGVSDGQGVKMLGSKDGALMGPGAGVLLAVGCWLLVLVVLATGVRVLLVGGTFVPGRSLPLLLALVALATGADGVLHFLGWPPDA